MSTPKIKFIFDRKHVASKIKKGNIDLRITLDKTQKFVSTGVTVYPKEWNEAKEEVVNVKEAIDLNNILLGLRKRVYKIIADMEESGNMDINAIPTLLKAKKVNISFLEYILDRAEKKPVGDYAKKTYAALCNKLDEYGKIVYFRDINAKSIRDFDEWLHAYTWKEKDRFNRDVEKHYSQSTIGSYHKNLKSFIADAVVYGYLQENVYVAKRIKIDKGEARIDKYLTIEELEQIEAADMPTASLAEARDLFVF
ncbi:MAG: phage integrase SAM-like domain-containing protein [Prevotella sp.]|nr:phage integrase SAM-like domain-containing protein [Prevotella sp.]